MAAISGTALEYSRRRYGNHYLLSTSMLVYSDYWEAYETVIPAKRHRAMGKDSGLTSYIERFNNTLRQRISRLVRNPLSFSKKRENHIGAIWNFIHEYNRLIREKMTENGANAIFSVLY